MTPGEKDMLQAVDAIAPTWAAGKDPTVKVRSLRGNTILPAEGGEGGLASRNSGYL